MKGRLLAMAAMLALAPAPLMAQDTPDAATSADSEARMALAREIAELAHAEEQLTQTFERMLPGVVSKMLGDVMRVSPDRDIAEEIENNYPGGYRAFEAQFTRRYAEQFRTHYPEMLEQIAAYWANNMSLEQLEATAAFFRTDLGGVWVGMLPGVYQHMAQLGRQYSLQEGIGIAGQMMTEFDSRRAASDESGTEAE